MERILKRHNERVVHLHDAKPSAYETRLAPAILYLCHDSPLSHRTRSLRGTQRLFLHNLNTVSSCIRGDFNHRIKLPSVPSSLQFCVVVLGIPVHEEQDFHAAMNQMPVEAPAAPTLPYPPRPITASSSKSLIDVRGVREAAGAGGDTTASEGTAVWAVLSA